MTPLAALLARIVPRDLVLPLLMALYAIMMVSLLLLGQDGSTDIAYVDVGRPAHVSDHPQEPLP